MSHCVWLYFIKYGDGKRFRQGFTNGMFTSSIRNYDFFDKGPQAVDYQHILLAVDYSEHCYYVADKAKQIAQQYQAQLTLLHVLDNIPMPDTQYGAVIPVDKHSDNELLAAEKAKILKLGDNLEIDQAHCFLVWGLPKREINAFAERKAVDLIVVGSHGRHGLALLLGSTANAVLHHANCDVLSVRLRD